jgi:hypothetical protein
MELDIRDTGDAPERADDPEVVAAAAAVYFHAAAHLSEASVLLRMSCRLIGDDGEASDDGEFERLVRATASALESAAAEYERAVDIVSRTAWGMRPDMAEHVDSIRAGVRALNGQAMHLTLLLGDDERGDGEEATPPDDEDLDWARENPLRSLLSDRADTFQEKAWLMARSARVFLEGAHTLAGVDPAIDAADDTA